MPREHQWGEPREITPFEWGYALELLIPRLERCTQCGILKRLDGLNNPCPGTRKLRPNPYPLGRNPRRQQHADWKEWVQL